MRGSIEHGTDRIRAAWLPLALALVVGGIGGPLVALPGFRLTEINESLPTKMQEEAIAVRGRLDHRRRLQIGHRRAALVVAMLASPSPQKEVPTAIRAPSGHRLSNGLLAPLTC